MKHICSVLRFVCAALDSDDLLYLKEQMEAEEDAERLLRRTEKRAFAAFKKAASLADSSPAFPLPLRVEPKPRSGIRQQDLLKKVLEVKPKKPRVSTPSDGNQPKAIFSNSAANNIKPEVDQAKKKEQTTSKSDKPGGQNEVEKPVKSLLGLAYASSDDED
ncbi:hypothetical protein CISIN_1g028797mg [Citrus sinensis]|uniref:Uncharacterized protein n=1 Tax=Citrus sinensis TaxID=2711 RepID=A0A067EXN4_CITSI|nr:hypothetical protein CISIN_1g028797mg [Citrus sinensis]KDO55986.1 hypothetical protein CISIN_1g028797mg [Citrus sinensis]KDO55987.1 hypothetical protein CISIN_1g028797mg [Citrus sinensis]